MFQRSTSCPSRNRSDFIFELFKRSIAYLEPFILSPCGESETNKVALS